MALEEDEPPEHDEDPEPDGAILDIPLGFV